MRHIALAAVLAAGLAMPASAEQDHQERVQRLEVPTAEQATHRECLAWLDELSGVMGANGRPGDVAGVETDDQAEATGESAEATGEQEPTFAERALPDQVMAEAEDRREQVAQACDDGRFHEGIVMAAETIDMLEEELQQ